MKAKSKALQSKKDHSWSAWGDKKDRFKRTGSTTKEVNRDKGEGKSHITGNIYKH